MSINKNSSVRAIAEAERFLSAAKSLQEGPAVLLHLQSGTWIEGGKLAARMKQASMDLSRALADVRRRGQ